MIHTRKDLIGFQRQAYDRLRDRAGRVQYLLTATARDIFKEELLARQPIGKLDQFALAYPEFRSEPRPSIRQGLIPIEHGWVGPSVRYSPWRSDIVLKSRSEHLRYFTRYAQDGAMGTHGSWVVARKKRSLAFWWDYGRNGPGAYFPQSSNPKGNRVVRDFVEESVRVVEKELPERCSSDLRYMIIKIMSGRKT